MESKHQVPGYLVFIYAMSLTNISCLYMFPPNGGASSTEQRACSLKWCTTTDPLRIEDTKETIRVQDLTCLVFDADGHTDLLWTMLFTYEFRYGFVMVWTCLQPSYFDRTFQDMYLYYWHIFELLLNLLKKKYRFKNEKMKRENYYIYLYIIGKCIFQWKTEYKLKYKKRYKDLFY